MMNSLIDLSDTWTVKKMSKGSKVRPYDKKKFDENFDKIFKKKKKEKQADKQWLDDIRRKVYQ